MELASEAESPASSHSFAAQALSNLAQLSLVCLKRQATLETCTEGLTCGVLDVKRQLFDAAVGVLLAIPPVITNVLTLLLNILAGNAVYVPHNGVRCIVVQTIISILYLLETKFTFDYKT